MTYVTRTAQFNHQQALARTYVPEPAHEDAEHIRDRVIAELRALGMRPWGLWRFDVRYLPNIIHEQEHIKAVSYGTNSGGSGMLVATDRRVIYLSKKPMFIKADELTYDIIGGITYGDVGVQATIILHSRIGDFKLTTFNLRLAQGFRDYIEERCLENLHNGAASGINHYDDYF